MQGSALMDKVGVMHEENAFNESVIFYSRQHDAPMGFMTVIAIHYGV
jgi:hypothetical protein